MNERDEQQLQLWLDGQLTGEDRRAFAGRLEVDPDLRQQLEMHEEILGSLRRTFVPPPMTAAPLRPGRPIRRWPWVVVGAAAASVVFLLVGRPSAEVAPLQPSVTPVAQLAAAQLSSARAIVGSSWVAMYDQVATPQNTLAPITSCSVANQLPDFVLPLAPDQSEPFVWTPQPNVAFSRGLDPSPAEDRVRILEFIAARGTTVLVFVLRASDDPGVALPTTDESPSLRLYRGERGALVLYELSPLERECVLPGLAASNAGRK